MYENSSSSMPTAAEMASCLREPCRFARLKERISRYFEALRREVDRPPKEDLRLIRKYGEVMGRLREDEATTQAMLEAFARGDAEGVREACERLVRR